MKKLIAIAGVLISVAALYWALRGIELDAVWNALQNINPLFLLAAFVPWFFTIWAKVARWRLLYYPDQDRVRQPQLFSAMMIGYLFNTVLPLRTGEIVRATVLRATEKLPIARTLSTILVEKVLDTMALIAGLGLILPFIALPADLSRLATAAALFFGALFVVVMAGAIWPQFARSIRDRALPVLPLRLRQPIVNLSDQVLEGLVPLRRREVAPRIVGWTIVTWVTNAFSTWLLLFGFNTVLNITAPALVVIATNLMMTVPSAPAYLGVFEATGKQALQVFGVDPTVALAFATLLHAFGFLPLALMGLISMAREGLSFAGVQAATREPAKPGLVTAEPKPEQG